MGKGSKNRATAGRTAREKDAGKMDGQRARESPPFSQSPRVFSLALRAFPHYLNANLFPSFHANNTRESLGELETDDNE